MYGCRVTLNHKVVMKTQSLEHTIYTSTAAENFGAPQLADLLKGARIANELLGLTGMLLHSFADGNFIQVLEGEPAAMDRLLQKLKLDKRHSNLKIMIREPIAERAFAGRAMGFASVSPRQLRKNAGLNDFCKDDSCFRQLDSDHAKRMLAPFALLLSQASPGHTTVYLRLSRHHLDAAPTPFNMRAIAAAAQSRREGMLRKPRWFHMDRFLGAFLPVSRQYLPRQDL